MEVAAASFKIVRLAISEGLIAERSLAKGAPSTIYKGLRLPLIEPNPRIRIVASDPGAPEKLTTFTPATSPLRA